MNIKGKIAIILVGIFSIWANSGCTTNVIAKECAFYEYPELSPRSEAFLDLPDDIDLEDTVIMKDGMRYYSFAPDWFFHDLEPMFRNKRSAKKYC